jgi:hypothetical protein
MKPRDGEAGRQAGPSRPEDRARRADPGVIPDRVDVSAWEEIEAGRFMPRRTRGSFPGRELG